MSGPARGGGKEGGQLTLCPAVMGGFLDMVLGGDAVLGRRRGQEGDGGE